jgi:hypothetical protein
MPSVAQVMRFRKEFTQMSRDTREKFINEFVSILEAEYKPVLSHENLAKVNAFEKALLSIQTVEFIPNEWYDGVVKKYSGTSYIDRLMYKMKI